ncbi:segregation/condensation protein A [Streptococcus sp. E17BB]|uniref:segregation/condensation protein A n=1 Tax=Streptococcus sp. E17BB TaxID=3278714 RepID=UPI00359E6FB4
MDIKLKDFEGPLDLLLHLVSQYKMDIYEVPLIDVIEQYLAYVSTLTVLRLEVAGDYMVMASQLMLIKSRRLLPKLVEAPPEDDDLEMTLLQQLEEYKLYKQVSQDLAEQHQQRALHFSKPKEEIVAEGMTLTADKSVIDLFLSFSKVMAAKQEQVRTSHTTIDKDDYKIEDMMDEIRDRFRQTHQLTLVAIFEHRSSLSELITLFLAVLELIKIKAIEVTQTENFGEVYLKWIGEKGATDVTPS